jgi:hypothetical protein
VGRFLVSKKYTAERASLPVHRFASIQSWEDQSRGNLTGLPSPAGRQAKSNANPARNARLGRKTFSVLQCKRTQCDTSVTVIEIKATKLRASRGANALSTAGSLERDRSKWNRHRALNLWWSMIFSENRQPLFRIMLQDTKSVLLFLYSSKQQLTSHLYVSRG